MGRGFKPIGTNKNSETKTILVYMIMGGGGIAPTVPLWIRRCLEQGFGIKSIRAYIYKNIGRRFLWLFHFIYLFIFLFWWIQNFWNRYSISSVCKRKNIIIYVSLIFFIYNYTFHKLKTIHFKTSAFALSKEKCYRMKICQFGYKFFLIKVREICFFTLNNIYYYYYFL